MKRKGVIDKDKLDSCEKDAKDLFMKNMVAKEALLSALPKLEYAEVKSLKLAHETCVFQI